MTGWNAMNMKKQISASLRQLLSLSLLLLAAGPALGQIAAISYQGQLTEAGSLASGGYDMQFKLFDTDKVGTGVQKGAMIAKSSVPVASGLFTVTLDFGATVFDGSPRFLEISVRRGDNPYSTLDPRQRVASIPYAIKSLNAATAATALSVTSGSAVKSLNNLKDDVTLAAGANVTFTTNGNTLTIASAGGGGGGGLWSLTGTDAYYDAGDVGIGTNAPTPGIRLEVIGATRLKPGNGDIQFGSPNAELGMSLIPNQGDNRDSMARSSNWWPAADEFLPLPPMASRSRPPATSASGPALPQ
jgi:hypothetical protein